MVLFTFKFTNILFDLLFQWSQIIFNHRPNLGFIDDIIAVYDKVAHTDNLAPRRLRVFMTKLFGQHVGGFANDNQLINYGKETHLVTFNLLKGLPVGKFIDIVDALKDMEKSSRIFNWLSHKSKPYLFQRTHERKEAKCHR